MTKSTTSREAYSKHGAQISFITHKINIDEALAILTDASANHFGVDPDDVTWAHCGDLHRISTPRALACAAKDLLDSYRWDDTDMLKIYQRYVYVEPSYPDRGTDSRGYNRAAYSRRRDPS